jgi:hypothetical protein
VSVIKIRIDFVTNSSSSSYIIAVKEPVFEVPEITDRMVLNILDDAKKILIEGTEDSGDNYQFSHKVKEIKTHDDYVEIFSYGDIFKQEYIDSMLERDKDIVDKIDGFINSGFRVFHHRFDQFNDRLGALFSCIDEDNPNIKVIEDLN